MKIQLEKQRVRCRVLHGNIVRRGRCVDVHGHRHCDANVYDRTPNRFRQMEQMHMGGHIRTGGNLLPRILMGTGDN